MKTLWNMINKLQFTTNSKNYLFLLLNTVIFGILGAFLWIPEHFFTSSSSFSLFYFIGYPAFFIGVIGGILFLYNHE